CARRSRSRASANSCRSADARRLFDVAHVTAAPTRHDFPTPCRWHLRCSRHAARPCGRACVSKEGSVTRSLRLATMLTVVGLARVAGATTFVAMDERTLARSADAIVLGTVTGRDTVGTPDGGIYTLVTLSIEGRYKGDVGATLVLKEPGGELDDRGLVIPGAPVFAPGEQSVLFLSAARDGSAHTTALGLGQYRVENGTGEPVAKRSVTEPVLGGSRVRRLKV